MHLHRGEEANSMHTKAMVHQVAELPVRHSKTVTKKRSEACMGTCTFCRRHLHAWERCTGHALGQAWMHAHRSLAWGQVSWTTPARLSRGPDSLSSKSLHPATAPPEVCMRCCSRQRKLVSPLIAILPIMSFQGFAEYHAVKHKERAGTSMHVATPPCCYP